MSRTSTLLAVAAVALAGAAQAQALGTPTPPPAEPSPTSDPSPMRYYPERAQRMEVNGDTVLDCNVTVEGRLDDCRVVSEAPTGYGFGEAALKVSRLWRMKPARDAGGHAIPGGRITIPLNWRVPK